MTQRINKMKKITFQVPTNIKDLLDIPEEAEVYWIYWEPVGDELMAGYLMEPPFTSSEFTSNWTTWFRLREMNPNFFLSMELDIEEYNLGSSEETATHALLFSEKDHQLSVYIASRDEVYEIQQKGKLDEPTERSN